MHCNHCVASVSSVFEHHKEIKNFKINLEDGHASFDADEDIDLESIQKEVSQVGNYQIELPYEDA